MKACGLCGSDLMDWYIKDRAPLILGHEPSGIIVEVGEKVEVFRKGERVFVHHYVACLTCHYSNLKIDTFKIPNEISFEEATLIEPVACCIRALRKCKIELGDTVAIIGAGPAGIIHTTLTRHLGASQILVSDFVDYRLKAAEDAGASVTVNPEREEFAKRVRAETDGRGADLVIVTAPNAEAYVDALRICRKGGTVCVFAPTSPNDKIEISPNMLFFNEIRIVPSYSTSHVETRMALQLILKGVIDAKKLITHRFLLERIAEAFKTAKESKECLKIVVLNTR